MTTTTKTRATFVTALAKVDEALKAERQPIGARALFLAVEAARASWPRWSPAHRPQARADLEAAMAAELAHARSDFLRIVDRHKALYLFDMDDPRGSPAEYYRLPRERAAAAASNALLHAAIQTVLVRQQTRRLRSAIEAAADRAQSPTYRESWAQVEATSRDDLATLIRRRRRDWRRALVLIAAYQKETV